MSGERPVPAEPEVPPLLGFTIGLTAARRRQELGALLERRGAKVLQAPALRIVPLTDDTELRAATEHCIAAPPDDVVATTGIGFRGWMEAADGWGLGDELRDRLRSARIFTRGPKVKGAVRAAELTESWSPASESGAELLDHLLAQDLRGRRIAVQLHGEPLPGILEELREAGADVTAVPVYRWEPPEDLRPVERMVDALVTGGVDAMAFTSAPGVAGLLRVADDLGLGTAVLDALRGPVLAVCVGPVCAAPLEHRGVPTVSPDRYRLGHLVRTICEELPARRTRDVSAGGHRLLVRGSAVVVDGRPVVLAPKAAAVLAALSDQPGRVLSRAELLARTGADVDSDEHAVEMMVGRLRRSLGPAGGAVQTVVKRGYRLACD